MKLWTEERKESYENAKICYICKKAILKHKIWKIKKIVKLEIIRHYAGEYRGAGLRIYNLKYSVPKKIPTLFLNGSNYDYQFVIKKVRRRIWKRICLLRRKHWKIHMLYSSIQRGYKNW